MIKKLEMFTVICDRCRKDSNNDGDYSCWSDGETAREMANNDDWIEIDGKDYCPACYELDEETDEYKPLAGPAEPGTKE
jgi:hypothetical protein